MAPSGPLLSMAWLNVASSLGGTALATWRASPSHADSSAATPRLATSSASSVAERFANEGFGVESFI